MGRRGLFARRGELSFGNRAEAEERMAEGIEAGKLSFTLRGRKLHGSWTLVRTSRGPKEWLLIKHKDEHADEDRDILDEDRSIVSALTLDDLKAGRLPEPGESGEPDGLPTKIPRQLKPVLARMAEDPFSNPDWIFEPKLDGHRATAYLRDGVVTLRSRTGRDITGQFPEVVDELQAQPGAEWVLDGEIVALNDDGLPDFGILQRHLDPRERGNLDRLDVAPVLAYYPFDLVHLDGNSLVGVPLLRRKALLERTVIPGDRIKLVDYVVADGEMFFDAITTMGLEGMVAKRADSMYEPGARSPTWIKVKVVKSQEFVVGGYTNG
jgi:bifunctional non-homologous end joining protein LigD